jgi:hypothetical protein
MKENDETKTDAIFGNGLCRIAKNGYGSPRNTTCSNTCCMRTAMTDSTCGKISKAAGPVPLYLIPQALSQEIHELKDTIFEVRIIRTHGHNYRIDLIASAKEEGINES